MLTIILLRHGRAMDRAEFKKWSTQPDRDRPLTPKGRRELSLVVRVLKKNFKDIDEIYTSPYLRTAQTALVVQKTYTKSKLQDCLALTPQAKANEFYQHVLTLKDEGTYLFVGHEPSISKILSFILCKKTVSFSLFKKGAFAAVELKKTPGRIKGARLICLMSPSHMKKIRKT